ATRKARFSTPSWVSFRSSMRDSSSGPRSDTVARIGWPCSPKMSQSVVGLAPQAGSGRPRSARRLASWGDAVPVWEMPERSPLTSAMKTGVPMRENDSARTCSVTVLPVPVAPVMQPWRLASCGSRAAWMSALRAMIRGSAMGTPRVGTESGYPNMGGAGFQAPDAGGLCEAVGAQQGKDLVGGLGRAGDQQAARSLRVGEQGAGLVGQAGIQGNLGAAGVPVAFGRAGADAIPGQCGRGRQPGQIG